MRRKILSSLVRALQGHVQVCQAPQQPCLVPKFPSAQPFRRGLNLPIGWQFWHLPKVFQGSPLLHRWRKQLPTEPLQFRLFDVVTPIHTMLCFFHQPIERHLLLSVHNCPELPWDSAHTDPSQSLGKEQDRICHNRIHQAHPYLHLSNPSIVSHKGIPYSHLPCTMTYHHLQARCIYPRTWTWAFWEQ